MSDSSAFVPISELHGKHRLYPKLQELREFYIAQFGTQPQFFVRVPGRVNIIGEHVDYCGYPVLPMAIDQCILLAVGSSEADSFLQLRNVDSSTFENFKCDLHSLSIDPPTSGGPEWYKYYLCGVKGVYEALERPPTPLGMTVALSGNIPAASGLSSSSALVSAATLATAACHELPLDRKRLAAISASCERYIGTQGGGMDQAIAYLARAGCAQFIEFLPELKATPIALPEGACFVVANSLAAANKAAFSDFNERVVECRLGARLIAKQMHLTNWRGLTRFAELQAELKCSLAELAALVPKCLPKDVFSRAEVCAELEVEAQEFAQDFLTTNTQHMERFKLRQRALHVVQESLRVCQFREICEKPRNGVITNGCNGHTPIGDGAGDHKASKDLKTLSQLMRESHRSLQDLYECSHPDLDRLVAISDAMGVGARLTGAGWGGCIVALCESLEQSEAYMGALRGQYFSKLPAHLSQKHRGNNFADVVFATCPGSGAEIFQ